MSEWAEREVTPPKVKEWRHLPTGVVLFITEREDGASYGVHIQATPEGSLDRVSIGDPETGLFEEFENSGRAVRWTDEWKEQEAVLHALVVAEEAASDGGTEE